MSAEVRDLRALLEAVCEALTVPGEDSVYRLRLDDRASWARAVIRGALDGDLVDVGWDAAYLRRKMAEEEAHAK
ncbi:hypothetical protein [Streptomyces sp. NPDC088794]|uniref:hypothetical protein n=1 Tax=Streptomyces sp. NPDC088794 TaxID=3365902 RepID=UPI0037F4B703